MGTCTFDDANQIDSFITDDGTATYTDDDRGQLTSSDYDYQTEFVRSAPTISHGDVGWS
jgi:hypothetical protein